MTPLTLHQKFALESELRSCQRGEKDPTVAIAELIQRWPSLQYGTNQGVKHPLWQFVQLTPDGRSLKRSLGL